MSTYRRKIHLSFVGLLVAYLRNQSVDTTNFTTVSNVSGAFPFGQNCWGFELDSGDGTEFFQVTYGTSAMKPIWRGVSILFGNELPSENHGQPQQVQTSVLVVVKTPRSYLPTQDSPAEAVARLIDLALYQNGARLEIKDYDVNPSQSYPSPVFMAWQKVRRGNWESATSTGSMEERRLSMMINYGLPFDSGE